MPTVRLPSRACSTPPNPSGLRTTCNSALIVRDWYEIEQYRVTPDGHCPDCSAKIAGCFEQFSQAFGARRIPVVMSGTMTEKR